MVQESRLVIAIDGRNAEQKADDLEQALEALERVGLKATAAVGDAGKTFATAGNQATSGSKGVDRLNSALGDTNGKAAAANSALTKMFAAATAGISAMSIIDTADQWGQYASRIRMATKDAAEYELVQRRMATSANETFRSINETREAFINMSPVIRDMGYSLEESMNAVDAFSGLLVVNGANAERGAAAIAALSKSLQRGKVDVDAWMTISSTADTIVQSLEKSTGKAAEEVRKLGIEGKLSGQQLVAALTGDYERVMAQVAEMPTTVRDALQSLNTAFTEYVGWQNQATGATALLSKGIGGLASNFDVLANVVGTVAVGAIAAYSTQMAIAAKTTLAKGAADARAALATATLTAQLNGTSVAAARATLAMRALHTALGPAGWISLAASAVASFLLFRDSADEAKLSTDALTTSIVTLNTAAERAASRYAELSGSLSTFTKDQLTQRSVELADQLANAERQLASFRRQFEKGMATQGMVDGAVAAVSFLKERIQELNNLRGITGTDAAGQSYLDNLKKQADMVGKVTEVEKVRTLIQKGYLQLSPEAEAQALKYAEAVDKGNAALKSNNKLTGDAAKALASFTKETQLSIASTNNLAAAYLKGADAVEEAVIQQKIEAEVLKQGEKQRAAITKAIRDQDKALKSLDLSKNIAEMRNQNKELAKYGEALLAGGEATKAGRDALADYNDQRELEAALVGKTAAEIKQLIPLLKAEQAERRSLNERNAALEELNALVIETRTEQEKTNAAFEHLDELSKNAKTPEHLEAIRRKTVDVQKQTSIWAKLTEGAVDRIDSAFADMWKGVLDGSKDVWSGLKDGLKQTLAEMLHMLTTKPLLQSFSDWISDTNSGQGIGDVLGRVFGGGGGSSSSSSSGSSFGSIIDIGKNLYSIYDTLTGVGSEIASGFMKDGLTGAFKGGINYYSTMLQSVYSKVASWFGQAVGQSAVQAGTGVAAEVAAQAGVSAAAQGAGTAAASGVGTGFLSGMMSSMMANITNPSTWAYIGALMSGKLYKAGVRLDADAMRDSTRGNTIGDIWTAYPAAANKLYATLDSIFEPLVGGRLAATITGSSLHQAIWTTLNGAIFGKQERFKTTVGSAVGSYSDGKYTGQGELVGWYDSAKRFGTDVDTALHSLNETFSGVLGDLLKMFDIEQTIETEASFRLRRTSGKLATVFVATVDDAVMMMKGQYSKDGNVAKGLEKFFDDVMGRGLAQAIGMSDLPAYLKELTNGLKKAEEVSAAIGGLFQRFDGANAAIELMGIKAFELSDKGLRAADSLIDMSAAIAGLENPTSAEKLASLGSLTEAYMAAFVPASDQYAATIKALRATFEEMDQTIPGSRKGFMDLVKALDLTTEEGRSAFATYMSLSEAMGNYYGNMEQLQANYLATFGTSMEQQTKLYADLSAEFSKLGVQMPSTRNGFRELVDGIDTTTEAGQDLQRMLLGLTGSMDGYYSSLESAQSSIAGNIGNLREQIYLDALGTDQNRYNYMKSQADNLAALLPNLFDVGAITDVTNKITQLTSQAYGLLDESGKNTNAQQMIEFLDKIQAQANEQLAKSNDESAQKQAQIIKDAITEASTGMAEQFKRAIIDGASAQGAVIGSFDSIVQQFGAYLFQMLRVRGGEVTG